MARGILVSAVLRYIWLAGIPVAFFIKVMDTWSSDLPLLGKVWTNLTIDVFIALLWPLVWPIWGIHYALGSPFTPLTTVFGL